MRPPFQITLIIVLIITAALFFWFASHTLEPWFLVKKTSGELVSVKGWNIAIALWPVMLIGTIPAFIILVWIGVWGLRQSIDADHETELNKLRTETDIALKRAERAESEARQKYTVSMGEAEKMRQEAAERLREANAKDVSTKQSIDRAVIHFKKIQDDAQEKILNAENRRRNASAAAERRRRKLEKIEAEKERQELNEFFKS